MLIASGVSAVVAAVLLVLRRRRLGGKHEAQVYERAIQSGRLPDGADPTAWRERLRDGDRSSRRTRLLLVPLGALSVVFGVAGAVLDPDLRVLGALLAVAFAALTVVAAVRVRHHLARLHRLLDRLPA